ncbi:RpiB/LacA/LacB family sugar-phosphate isomerase [bacterium]|nr:RpiB/LacA/LacB family sugar-phosphate isomerase [bacterium]
MKIAIGNDHRGYKLKLALLDFLKTLGHEVTDMGFHDEQSSDHPIAAFKVGEAVVSGEVDRGVVICGSGVGVTVSVNKVKGVYAFAPMNEDQARMSREHNDTNVIAFGANFIEIEPAKAILKVWLETDADNDERFIRRRKQISDYENDKLNPQ